MPGQSAILTSDRVTTKCREIEKRIARGDLRSAALEIYMLRMQALTQDFSLYGWTKRLTAIDKKLQTAAQAINRS